MQRELLRRSGVPEKDLSPETPGVLTYDELQTRLATWDAPRICVGISAQFWEGADALLYPPSWLDHSHELARRLIGAPRQALGLGVDPGEGSADTSLSAVDLQGLIAQESRKTPDTSTIPDMVIDFGRRVRVPPHNWALDRGGGGKQAADVLRRRGYPVRTIAFGGAVETQGRRKKRRSQQQAEKEERTAYLNLRALLFWQLRELLDPAGPNGGFAIPEEHTELRRQLAPIPLTRDGEGVFYVLPKTNRDPKSAKPTLTKLIGRSPDQADSLCLAIHAMLHPAHTAVAGAL